MSVTNPTNITKFNVAGVDRRNHLLRIELNRTVNSVGTWAAFLRNPGGFYNGIFDVQYRVEIAANSQDLFYGVIDGPAVELMDKDLESGWDEYITLRGVDDAQDLLFHNDLAFNYPNINQDLDDVLDDVINTQLDAISASPIWYTPRLGTPLVGAFEFKAGTSFLTQLQELMRLGASDTGSQLFYVEDNSWELKIGSALAGVTASGVIARSILNDPTNNIIDRVLYQERDGDKLYNYVKLYGKSPMQDGYTEQNAASWTVCTGGTPIAVLDDTTTTLGGRSKYSLVVYNNATTDSYIGVKLTIPAPNPLFNYNMWDFSSGEIVVWARYDNTAGAPGTPDAGSAGANEYIYCWLTDTAGNQVIYYGASSYLYRENWTKCAFPLGERARGWIGFAVDTWTNVVGTTFLWDRVVSMEFILGLLTPAAASHLYLDGLSIPLPIIGFSRDGPAAGTSEAKYRRRPYDDTWAHIGTQNAIQGAAENFLLQSRLSSINRVKLVIPGDYRLRYAGQTFTVDIPSIGVNGSILYATNLKHIIEPYIDVSGGYAFDWVTEVEGVPTTVIGYDGLRLRAGSSYSAVQAGQRGGAGLRAR
jgi:hypothetical protein